MIFSKSLRQLIIYFFVGLGATVVEWAVFYVLDIMCKIHYTYATCIAFAISTFANWGLGKLLLFKKNMAQGLIWELLAVYGVSCLGLLANLLIMFISISCLSLSDFFSKIIATFIVFIGNFLVRKLLIYKV